MHQQLKVVGGKQSAEVLIKRDQHVLLLQHARCNQGIGHQRCAQLVFKAQLAELGPWRTRCQIAYLGQGQQRVDKRSGIFQRVRLLEHQGMGCQTQKTGHHNRQQVDG